MVGDMAHLSKHYSKAVRWWRISSDIRCNSTNQSRIRNSELIRYSPVLSCAILNFLEYCDQCYKLFVHLFSESSYVNFLFRIRIKTQLFYLITDISPTFCYGTCSETTDLFRFRECTASILHEFTAVGTEKIIVWSCWRGRHLRTTAKNRPVVHPWVICQHGEPWVMMPAGHNSWLVRHCCLAVLPAETSGSE
jgi:hypothetical protein